jgi:hypothetical protein
MEEARRHFLRTISGVAALPAIGSVLITEPHTGLGAASSRDARAQFVAANSMRDVNDEISAALPQTMSQLARGA